MQRWASQRARVPVIRIGHRVAAPGHWPVPVRGSLSGNGSAARACVSASTVQLGLVSALLSRLAEPTAGAPSGVEVERDVDPLPQFVV